MGKKKRDESAETNAVQLRLDGSVAAADFIKIEKNLSSIGFFTATNGRVKGVSQKTVTSIREIDGKLVETRATILPSAKYGLPITADQDKYLALQKIVTEIRMRDGKVSNPIGFTSAQLLRILGRSVRSGKNYDDVAEWMKRMTLTGINSQGVVYLAGRKRWADKTFHVFESAVTIGQELPDGSTADMNYIWLSEWQLENINNNYVMPVDLEIYRKLKNHIAKALVPLLQVWLYASRSNGCFEKRYTELCQILNIRRWQHLSKIKQVLSPSFNELKTHGYLADWSIEPTSDELDFKVTLRHGEKFHRDHRSRLDQREQAPRPDGAEADTTLLMELVARGIHEDRARQVLTETGSEQPVLDQLEWGDHIVASAPKEKFYNPPGFYLYLVRQKILPPKSFVGSRKRSLHKEGDHSRELDRQRQLERELAYEEYRQSQVEAWVHDRQDTAEYRSLTEAKRKEILKLNKSYGLLPPATLAEVVEGAVRAEIAKKIEFINFETFCEQAPQLELFEQSPPEP